MSTSAALQSSPPRAFKRWPLPVRMASLVVGALLAVTVVTTVTASSARLSAPAQATPGATVRVSGTGLTAGQAGFISYEGVPAGNFTASRSGEFSLPFTIPLAEPIGGTGEIDAQDASGVWLATATIDIVAPEVAAPALSVPVLTGPGATVTVTGYHFKAGQTGYLTLNGSRVAALKASSDGSFTIPVTIPKGFPTGTDRISARTNSLTLLATTTIFVNAGAVITVAKPGETAVPTTQPSATTTVPTSAPPATLAPTPAPTPVPTATSVPPTGAVPNFSHIYVIVMENHEYSSIVGSSSAPYTNSLIAKYGLATAYYGVGHPSEPNYIALTSGATQGVNDDGVYNLGVDNIFHQVSASGRTWRAYQQGYPGGCFTGSSSGSVSDGPGKSGSYVRKHNPAISYTDISGNKAACANITNLASFNPAAASFSFITPNLVNDMHDGSVADGDNFLKSFVPQITGSAAFSNSLIFITVDEGSSAANGGGHVVTLAITPGMTPGYKATAGYNHYSMLRTIEQAWGLPYLGHAAAAQPMDFPY